MDERAEMGQEASGERAEYGKLWIDKRAEFGEWRRKERTDLENCRLGRTMDRREDKGIKCVQMKEK
jgi:hypothetical protein